MLLASTSFLLSQNSPKCFEWPENKKAAVCLTFDDALDNHLDKAIPLLDSFNFKATFYCPGSASSLSHRMPEWRKIVQNGHEIGNHTLFHPCDKRSHGWVKPEYDLSKYSREKIENELFTANTLLKAIDGKAERTFAYTCSNYKTEGDISFVDIVSKHFVAARTGPDGGRIPSTMNDADLFFMPSLIVNDNAGKELIAYAKEAKKKGTIAIFMFHNVGGGYLNVSTEALHELLDYLDKNKNDYWVDSFYNVTKHIKTEKEKIIE